MSRRPEPVSLVGGVLLVLVGALLLAGRSGAFEVGLDWLVPVLGVLLGGVLLAAGLARHGN